MSYVNHPSHRPPSNLLVAGRYLLERPLHRTARDTTWIGTDSGAGNARVVVQLFRERVLEPTEEHQALDEHLAAMRELTFAHLPKLIDFGWEDKRRFVVFDGDDAPTLHAFTANVPHELSRRTKQQLIYGIAQAVAALHEAGFLHLGLTPDSIVIDPVRHQPRLLDWGRMVPINRYGGQHVPVAGLSPEGIAYTSRELLAGETADPRDDVYAYGCVAYEVLTGTHPYGGRSARDAASARLHIEPVRHLSGFQNELLAQALALNRTHRLDRLDRICAAFEIAPPRPAASARAMAGARAATGMWPSWYKRLNVPTGGLRTGALAAATLVVVGGIVYVAFGPGSQPAPTIVRPPIVSTPAVAQTAKPPQTNDRSSGVIRTSDRAPVRVAPAPGTAPSSPPPAASAPAARPAPETASTATEEASPTQLAADLNRLAMRTSRFPGYSDKVNADIAASAAATAAEKAAREQAAAAKVQKSSGAASTNPPTSASPRADRPTSQQTALATLPASAPPAARGDSACPGCDCASLQNKRTFSAEPLRAEEQAFLRRNCSR
jgi:serine/threonine protein kinase